MCEQVLPRFSEINSSEEGLQLDVLKLFAELCSHCNSLPNNQVHVQQVLDKLMVSLPYYMYLYYLLQLELNMFQL